MDHISIEYLYSVERYFTFSVFVRSGSFSGASNFCLSEEKLREATLSLNDLCKKLNGAYQIDDYDSDDFLLFECLKLGHIEITGQLGGSHSQQHLRFQFLSDQTVLQSIVTAFHTVLQKAENYDRGL